MPFVSRPGGQFVDVRDLPRPFERQLRPRGDGGPPDDVALVVVRQHPGGDRTPAQLTDILPAQAGPARLWFVPSPTVAQAPCGGLRVPGSEHGGRVRETLRPGRHDLDAHPSASPPPSPPGGTRRRNTGGGTRERRRCPIAQHPPTRLSGALVCGHEQKAPPPRRLGSVGPDTATPAAETSRPASRRRATSPAGAPRPPPPGQGGGAIATPPPGRGGGCAPAPPGGGMSSGGACSPTDAIGFTGGTVQGQPCSAAPRHADPAGGVGAHLHSHLLT